MKKTLYVFFGILATIFLCDNVYAASASLSGSSSVIIGDTTTITSRISSNNTIFFIEGTLKCSGAGVNKSIDLSFDNMDNGVKSNSKSIKITPTSEGKINCEINAKVIDSSNSNWVSVKNSGTINVVKPREKSTNNNLSKLEVEGYTLEPNFNKDTLEYNVKIDKNVEKVKINASLEDKYAKVAGTGEVEVLEGTNKIEVVATSETGASKTYTLNIDVKDSNPIIKEIDGKNYTVIKRIKSLTLPTELNKDAFVQTTVNIDGTDIPAYKSESLDLCLIGLKDDNGSIYLYEVIDNKIANRYEILSSKEISVLFIEPKEIIEGYTKSTISIGSKEYVVYKNDINTLIYGTNIHTNEDHWYKYDEKENTIQIFDTTILDELKAKDKEIEDLTSKYMVIIMTLGGIIGLLLIILIIVAIKSSKKKNRQLPKPEENKPIKKIETKNEEVNEVKKIAKPVDKKKEKSKEGLDEIEEEIKKAQEEVEDIPDFEEIEKDLKDDEDELMDPYEFLDIKKRRRRK